MKMSPLRVMLSTGVLILAACQPATNGLAEAQKGLEKASAEMEDSKGELAKAQEKLATENFSLKDDGSHLPKAELTPDGELLIEGKPVPMNAEQKALGRAYRTQIQSVARDGIAIGLEGAKLGIDAAASALKGVLSGKSDDEISKQTEATVKEKIKPRVQQLCARMPALLQAQQAWAAAQPEFRPYATMDESDVKDCMNKQDWDF
ncbi:hypothetical protein [Pseudoxanthomonas winnipegensis]|jgi:hypothetical protein|uniref:DUF2884 family protein n=1 Tax=Pseudoxanthomonas winnipegensis TaxID=2480810 RepID=A0A4Q9TDV1_9GAMM|nr:hypothetical protein [Pseudoxanthomonas winnipegensis]RZZ86942.1 hypothetical protein EA663_08695 [Pseudoxanthomonas winnipegensis]RZZ87539.1 hypothetical protein EA662_06385 [Pseudoxanthomonas winnipegensis]TAA07207.1 hypothetical protein EA659_18110 [Pseudoxanthomonas winnipegensis]TAA20848.1 hypothetical protein EA658_07885 [Pseudoxanthomonas winnipegensis]TAA29676.1 hypothetical protein EA661_08970 [Pseudoxanthomonas winnipegensis]